jgi:YVTN family beta-propeller protein
MKSNNFLAGVLMILMAGACKKEVTTPIVTAKNAYKNAVFIINQGNFGKANGDISYFDRDSLKIKNDLFAGINSRPVGDVLQSLAHFNNSYYIIANSSGKIEIVDDSLFKQAGVITGLNQPRYIVSISSTKAYVSEWGVDGLTGTIAVIDLTSKTITKRISVGKGAENMIMSNSKLFVASSGGYGVDSTVFVVDYVNDKVTDTIKVKHNPNSFAVDVNGKLWVLCGGKMTIDYSMETQPALVRINSTNNSVESTTSMSGSFSIASNLCINNDKSKLFFGLLYGSGVFSMNIGGSTISNVINKTATGLGIDPKNNYIYCADPGDYKVNGSVYRYNQSYQMVDSFKVGMVPGGFLFN